MTHDLQKHPAIASFSTHEHEIPSWTGLIKPLLICILAILGLFFAIGLL